MTNKGLELTLDIPSTANWENIEGMRVTHCLLPLHCELRTCEERFDNPSLLGPTQPTLRLRLEVRLEDEVLRGQRDRAMLAGKINRPNEFKVLESSVEGRWVHSHTYGTIIGCPGATKRWKVYVPQAGL